MKGIKIDHEEMKKLYEAHIAEKSPQKGIDCPSPELISSLLKPNTSESIGNETLAHVLTCSHCTKEFQLILSTLRVEKKFLNEIEEVFKPTEKDHKKEKGTKSFFFRLSWKYAFFLIGAAIIAVVFMLKITNIQMYRGTNHKSIRLVSPLDQHYKKSNILFEWEMVEHADSFIIEIFDESLYPIWKSEKITGNRMNLPSDALAQLDSSRTYYWVVSAFMPNNRIIESQLQKFEISR